ncbi:MAG: hypothetical protein APF78_05385 [Sphingomonadales bacterium BRH_c3]|nr:MAG: hypothetical protein APF78_05385 [Sphingomonadales bacterium BRH_c3]
MDLRQLRCSSVLAETLNFNRAAARLNMAQPPLGVAIRKLVKGLGTAQEALQLQTILCLVLAGLGVARVPWKTGGFAPNSVEFVELDGDMAIELGIAHSQGGA